MNSYCYCLIIYCVVLWLNSELTSAIIGGEQALQPPPDDPVVFINRHGRTARILGTRDSKRYNFKGIRYAQPPIGALRFQRPRTYAIRGDLNATIYGPPCPQIKTINNVSMFIGDEDCLYINVFTPQLPNGGEGLPVLVWIHGGGFRVGSAAQYNPKPLIDKNLVMVTFQYRLGSLGFLSTGRQEQSGNAGLFDINLALRWVRDYIQFFNGNPRKVTVMGQGTGGSAAVLVGMSDITKGYTHGIIAMSGTSLSQWSIDQQPEMTARSLSVTKNCPQKVHVEWVKCLQNQTTKDIIESDLSLKMERQNDVDVKNSLTGLPTAGPVKEGENDNRYLPSFVPRDPLNTIQTNKFKSIPLLTGVTRDETSNAIRGNVVPKLFENLLNPDYLKTTFIKSLQSFTSPLNTGFLPIVDNINSISSYTPHIVPSLRGRKKRQLLNNLNQLSPLQFDNYLKLANPKSLTEALSKAVEVTTDALFNFPAFLTVNLWSKSASPAYLYNFEHNGNAAKGYKFLEGVSLVTKETQDKQSISHGDDLGYIFNPQTIFGDEIDDFEKHFTSDDRKVRDVFTDLISDFAHNIVGVDNNKSVKKSRRSPKMNSLLKPFNEKDNNYISIKPKPESINNFRFCQMALWGGLAERLQSQSCQFLNLVQDVTKNLGQNVGQAGGKVGQKVGDTLTNPLGVVKKPSLGGGFLGR